MRFVPMEFVAGMIHSSQAAPIQPCPHAVFYNASWP
jgi:hypothetical protein